MENHGLEWRPRGWEHFSCRGPELLSSMSVHNRHYSSPRRSPPSWPLQALRARGAQTYRWNTHTLKIKITVERIKNRKLWQKWLGWIYNPSPPGAEAEVPQIRGRPGGLYSESQGSQVYVVRLWLKKTKRKKKTKLENHRAGSGGTYLNPSTWEEESLWVGG